MSSPPAPAVNAKAPAIKKGWLKKQGRSGMIKNWKTRYFVISQGMLNYYQEKSDDFPFGEGLKGDLYLGNTEIIEENRNYNDKQIYIVNFNGDKNILIEAETAEEAQQWMESIREHMMYANRVARESSAILDRRSQTSDKRSSLRFANQSSIAAVSIDESRRYSNIIGHPAVPITKPRSESVDSDDAAPLSPTVDSHAGVAAVPVVPSRPLSTASSGDDEQENSTPLDKIESYILEALSIFTDSGARRGFFTNFSGNLRLLGTGTLKNMKAGQSGKRGEKEIAVALFLAAFVLLGFIPVLRYLVAWVVKLAAVLALLVGQFLSLNALWELRGNFNVFVVPGRDNQLTTEGVYSLVRHPFYGGIVIVCLSVSVLQGSMEKLALSFALLYLLTLISKTEEKLLADLHKTKYLNYKKDKKLLIPFVH